MRQLKIRQVQQLGLMPDQAEAFFLFCEEGKPDTTEKIKALDAFFALADACNAEKGCYNVEKLRASFGSVILSSAGKLPIHAQKELVATCRFLSKRDLLMFTFKQKIKIILGRK